MHTVSLGTSTRNILVGSSTDCGSKLRVMEWDIESSMLSKNIPGDKSGEPQKTFWKMIYFYCYCSQYLHDL
jgi:hypothetical protein